MTPAQANETLRIAERIVRQERAAELNITAFAFRGEARDITKKINKDWSDD